MNPDVLRLYLVTDAPEAYFTSLLASVEEALAGGVTAVQYRAEKGSNRARYETARALRRLLRPRRIPLIINNHLDLALAVEAEGVHLGQDDLPVAVARRLLGPARWIGLSLTTPEQLRAVPLDAVDYLGLGPVFATRSKADAAPALGLPALRRMVAESPLPTVAIGGITAKNAHEVWATGVDGLAMVSALSRVDDPAAAVRTFLATRPAPT